MSGRDVYVLLAHDGDRALMPGVVGVYDTLAAAQEAAKLDAEKFNAADALLPFRDDALWMGGYHRRIDRALVTYLIRHARHYDV